MKKQLTLFAALIASTSLSFGATLNSINQDQFKQAFIGKTFTAMKTAQLNGKEVNNSVSVFIGDQNKIKGKFADKPANGPQADEGVYTLKEDGMICINWQHWFNGKEECLSTYDTQNAYMMVDSNNVFHFSIMKFAIKAGDNLKK